MHVTNTYFSDTVRYDAECIRMSATSKKYFYIYPSELRFCKSPLEKKQVHLSCIVIIFFLLCAGNIFFRR